MIAAVRVIVGGWICMVLSVVPTALAAIGATAGGRSKRPRRTGAERIAEPGRSAPGARGEPI